MIIRADRAFFEAMREAGYNIDLPTLRTIYDAAKAMRPKADAGTEALPMFPGMDTEQE